MSISNFFLSFFLFFVLISFGHSSSSFHDAHKGSRQQSLDLLLFKESLSFTNQSMATIRCQYFGSGHNPIMTSWNTSTDYCKWDGITCDHLTGDVIGIDLSCGMLHGTLHPNSTLFHLPRLQRLNLAFNDFYPSQLPREIGRFSSSLTYLNISDCGLTGQIPSEITLLSKLVSLDLSWNQLGLQIQGHVLNNLLQNSTHLRELFVAHVYLSLALPTHLNLSSSLNTLDLSYTGLQGELPDSIFNHPYLEILDLSGNFQLTGSLPKFVINQSSLIILSISYSNLEGKLSDNIFNLPYLQYLDLSGNLHLMGVLPKVNMSTNIPLEELDLSDTGLSGTIPDSIGLLKSLNYLDLSLTGLSGEIPNSIGNLRSLSGLILQACNFVGTLPRSLTNLTQLSSLYLDSNMLSGSLPSELFNHSPLMELSHYSNLFSGEINQGSIQLINLTYLDLSFNNFTGLWELDTLLSSLPSLVRLRLSYSGLSVATTNAAGYVNPNFRELSLASCNITMFPKSLQAMKNLTHLDLSSNDIEGPIPDWAGEIGENMLYHLNLSYNSITGLPQFKWYALQYLSLQANLIQGQFPSSICNMTNLQYLDMSINRFGGVIPECFENIISSLQLVDMGSNRYHGTIPNANKDCGNLNGLILDGNLLEGDIPIFLSKCQNLEVLDIGNNQLNGPFPSWLGNLSSLQVLVLKSNNLHGFIETSSTIEHPFPSLQVIDLSHNRLIGHFPSKYFRNFIAMKDVVMDGPNPQYLRVNGKYYSVTMEVKDQKLLFPKVLVNFTIIDLSDNKFDGVIPNDVGGLNSLKVLNLSHNNLNGRIPYALGNLSQIESLDLSWNQLSGEIPLSLTSIMTLEVLNLSQNHLVGRIPEGKQFSTFDANSFGGNPRLCGFPLPQLCEHSSSPQVENDGDGDDEESGFTWKVVMLGYGCGTVLGMVLGYLMLSTGRPKWFNGIADALEHLILKRKQKRRYIYIGN